MHITLTLHAQIHKLCLHEEYLYIYYVDVGVKSLSQFNASPPLSVDCDSLEF